MVSTILVAIESLATSDSTNFLLKIIIMEYIFYLAFMMLATCNQPKKILASAYIPPMANSDCSGLVHELANCTDGSMCPTWFMCTSEKTCRFGHQHKGEIVCDYYNNFYSIHVLDCYCVTYNDETQATYVGTCYYNCYHNATYHLLPNSPTQLINNSVCTQFHRTGLLCGDCEEGYSPLVLSYNLSCVKCPDGHKNWWKFILAGFVPLTCFYFIVLLFNINVTSSRLHGVVWFSQALSTPVLIRRVMLAFIKEPANLIAVKVLLVFYSFWNLDLFRSVIPDICLNISTLQALALDYLVAFYPSLLLFTSYLFITLYDRKIRFIIMVWKPFQSVISIFQKSWKVQTSPIDAFASVFLLSYIKIMNVTMDLLIPTQIHQLGSNTSTLGLFYSPSVTYFGRDHLPYAIFALVVFVSFIIAPLVVLILYPFQFFQKLLSFIPLRWNILHGFIDSFQGCYKDGTEPGTFDCRWFSVLVLLTRLFVNVMLATTHSSNVLFLYIVILVIIYLIAIINIQPYKKTAVRYPSTDLHFLILLSFCLTVALGIASLPSLKKHQTALTILVIIAMLVPLLYVILLIGSWLVSKKR